MARIEEGKLHGGLHREYATLGGDHRATMLEGGGTCQGEIENESFLRRRFSLALPSMQRCSDQMPQTGTTITSTKTSPSRQTLSWAAG